MTIKSQTARHTLLILSGLILTLLLVSAVLFKKQINGRTQETTPTAVERPTSNEQNPSSQASSTFVVSNTPADQQLQSRIDHTIESSGLASARWGAFVISLRDGRVVYAREADNGFIPASNMKLYTTAVALELLGTDYRWRTSVYAASRPDKDGNIDGNLTLYGRGAPDLVLAANGLESSLGQLATELYRNGVRHVRGNVVGDEDYFCCEPLGDGWLWNDAQWYYGAEVSALSIGGNEFSLSIAPGEKLDDPARVKLEPENGFVEVKNEALTVASEKPATIGITRGPVDNAFRILGDFPLRSTGFHARLAVHKPALLASYMFRKELLAHGITVEGDATTVDALGKQENERFDSQREIELASLSSKTLGEVTRAINKESLNLESELVLRTLGKLKGATAPDPDPHKMSTRGDDQAGVAVIRQWLEQKGISTLGLALHDGSGLSRLDLVTPAATARLLAAMSKSPVASVFRDSLPVAGRDGTLHTRLRLASARIFAKTGSLTYTNSLSGYVETRSGELLAFSILCNNDTSPSLSTSILDEIALLLAEHQ